MISLLLTLTCLGPVESIWTEPTPLLAIVRELKDRIDQPHQQIPGDLVDLLEIGDSTVRLFAKPAQHYYRFEFAFTGRRFAASKSLEVWGLGAETRFRSRISTSWGPNGPLIRWLLHRVELRLMGFERDQIRTLTKTSSDN